jgi:hypothetical protein
MCVQALVPGAQLRAAEAQRCLRGDWAMDD